MGVEQMAEALEKYKPGTPWEFDSASLLETANNRCDPDNQEPERRVPQALVAIWPAHQKVSSWSGSDDRTVKQGNDMVFLMLSASTKQCHQSLKVSSDSTKGRNMDWVLFDKQYGSLLYGIAPQGSVSEAET